jgi:hypothetical protein
MAVSQQQGPTTANEFNTLSFLIEQRLNRLQTITLVKVVKVTNTGGVSPVGFVDVQPLVNQMTGDRVAVPHGVIFNIPYFRMQGGANAIILDPQVGDIGMCAFASRDLSAVKADPQAAVASGANPGSLRTFDYADGLYFGGLLNGVPTQYVAFASGGITVVSPTKITLQAPEIDLKGTVVQTGGNVSMSGSLTVTGDVTGHGTSLHTHEHSGVTAGGANTGPPV